MLWLNFHLFILPPKLQEQLAKKNTARSLMVDVKQENTRYVLLPVAEPERLPSRTASYWACYFVVMSISFAGFIDYSVVMPSAQSYCQVLTPLTHLV